MESIYGQNGHRDVSDNIISSSDMHLSIVIAISTGYTHCTHVDSCPQAQTLRNLNVEEAGRLQSRYQKCVTEPPSVRTAAMKLQIFAQVCKSSTHARECENLVFSHTACVVGCYNLNREKCTWSEEYDATECGGCLKGYVDVGKEECVYYKGNSDRHNLTVFE